MKEMVTLNRKVQKRLMEELGITSIHNTHRRLEAGLRGDEGPFRTV